MDKAHGCLLSWILLSERDYYDMFPNVISPYISSPYDTTPFDTTPYVTTLLLYDPVRLIPEVRGSYHP